ncbi:MAG TPA: alpha-(1-_3)-arabinofuranosyltransferase family protein [Acidimicrobiales bacterium]|nr:alpha-(1->3)-arabinofuranosyltransferase family protein [Acidimicrobiales bacterium]
MVRPVPSSGRAGRRARTTEAIELVGLVVAAAAPFLRSSPGRLSPDTKVYLYLDPGRLLSRAPHLWDPHVGAGGVPHQQIGYLWPMGPWFWLFDRLGVPDGVAQRLWWTALSVAAVLGARWLLRMLGASRLAALAGAAVYLWTPYQLAFTTRMSALLLPWAGLPWLVGLALRAVRRSGWRDPARFALVVLTVGGVNASSLLLVGVAPAAVVALHLRSNVHRRAASAAAARMAVLSVGVSLWWIAALRLQGAYGLPVLDLTENLRTVAAAADPLDLLRGLGNWFFYGRERSGGFTLDQTSAYVTGRSTRAASYLVPAAALAAAAMLRWRHRAAVVTVMIGATVIGAGAWPHADPSPFGRAWRVIGEGSAVGLALRNTPRIVPVAVLAMSALLAAAITAVRGRRVLEPVASAAVVLLAAAAFTPALANGVGSDRVSIPEHVPAYWLEAAAAIDAGGRATRVLEVPGSNFATYRWGNAIDPITPGLVDRPYLAREVLPAGTPASADLLDAFDRRIQQGVLEASSVAPVARLLRAGTVVLRGDLERERFGGPDPAVVRAGLSGLEESAAFGPVALFDVPEPVPIVRTTPAEGGVLLAGDGDGVVDASAAGLLDGRALLRSWGAEDGDHGVGHVIVTDTYRRRPQHWFSSIRFTRGATERAGQRLPDRDGYDVRLDPFDRADDRRRTVVEHDGGTVDATADGGIARPEDRAVRAYDGELRTAWRVGGADPSGARLALRTDRPVTADRIVLVQPQDGPRDRVLTSARLRFDDEPGITVDLGPASLEPAGQEVQLDAPRTFRRLVVELGATTAPPFDPALANAVGFAEVRVGGVEVDEVVRLPRDLPAVPASTGVDVVLSRLRADPAQTDHQDEEPALDRRFALGGSLRAFAVHGTARLAPNVDGAVLDGLLGTTAAGATFSASGHLAGSVEARASMAFDDDPATAWTAPAGPSEGRWIEAALPAPVTVDRLVVGVIADGRHAVPTRVRLETADGAATLHDLPPVVDGPEPGHVVEVALLQPATTSDRFRLVVESTDRRGGLPVALASVDLGAGVPVASTPTELPAVCRDDLLRLDGAPLSVRLVGPTDAARRGFGLQACDPADEPTLGGGDHRLTARPGLDTGIDVDRLVLSSAAGGAPGPLAVRGSSGPSPGPRVERRSPTKLDVTIDATGDDPFWLVLGESHSPGWRIDVDGPTEAGPHTLVDGYANGWLVRPGGAGRLHLTLTWVPQRTVWVGLALSALAVVACLGLAVAGPRGRRPDEAGLDDLDRPPPRLGLPGRRRPSSTRVLGLAVAFGLAAGPLAGASAGAAALVPGRLRSLLVPLPALLVAIAALRDEPGLAWSALGVLATLVLTDRSGPPAERP